MRILHLIQRFPPAIGGVETWCEGVTRYQAAQGHAVEVLTLRLLDEDEVWNGRPSRPGPAAVGCIDLRPGVRVRRCAPSPTPHGLLRLCEALGVRVGGRFSAELFGLALAAARRADVVHLHHGPAVLSFAGLAIARLARRPAVITPHFHPGDPYQEQAAVRRLLHWCDVVLTVTPHEAAELARRGVPAQRIVTASNAIDAAPLEARADMRAGARTQLGVGAHTALVTFLGRKSQEKDLPTLIDAAGRLAPTKDLALALAGPSTEWYRARSSEWTRRGAHVIDLPAVSEHAKRALLAASDVLVQPSPREAFGIVFLEAWACGVPVIGAASGAVPDVVGDGGLTFAPGDAGDLEAKLGWLLDHPEDARAMAARGRARVVRDHSWERVGTAVDEAYALALGRRRPAPATR